MASESAYPPFSRLFVIGDKRAKEEDYTTSFDKFGEIATVTFIKDKSGQNKGIVYIQMKKTSDACKAVEAMDGQCVGDSTRPLKVLIATNRSDSSTDEDIMAQVSRLFVVIPKTHTEEDVRQIFEKYGNIRKIVVVKDKKTNESRGLSYVTFQKASDAAMAYEDCSPDFRPKFADPVPRKRQFDDADSRSFDGMRGSGIGSMSVNSGQGPADFMANFPHNNQFYLKVRTPKGLTQHQLTRLFNIVPTLEFCRLATNQFSTTDTAIVGFSSASCCAYAKEALHGFEYPPGCPLDIEYYDGNGMDESGYGSYNNGAAGGVYAGSQSYSQTQMYGQQTAGRSSYQPPSPPSGTTVLSNSETKKRLFIVSYPERVSTRVLSDMFSRFGNFISVSYIPGKNYGFAKFASVESADNAQKYMHGENISGNNLKCLEAEDPPPESKKAKN